jgi:hypothetical protein
MNTHSDFWLSTRKQRLAVATAFLLVALSVPSVSTTPAKSRDFEGRQYSSLVQRDYDPLHMHVESTTIEPTTIVTIAITGDFFRFQEVPPVIIGAGQISTLYSTRAEAVRAVALARAKNPESTYSIFRVDAEGRAI